MASPSAQPQAPPPQSQPLPASVPTGGVPSGEAAGEAQLELFSSRQFPEWLAENRVSIAFTTYQSGKLFLIGLQPNGRLSVFERTFNRCMGMWSDGQTLWMSTLYQLWRFENALAPGELHDGYDRLFVPRIGYTTGDVDVHDIAVDRSGRPLFIATLFGCLATVSDQFSIHPLWRPPFLSRLAAEDRCHLNGLAMVDGRPAYVTAVSRSDVFDGWRAKRRDGGVVVEVDSGRVVAEGLSMPHSPRWHQGKLWLLDSGTGYFGWIDPAAGRFERMTFCPGYLRGLGMVGNFAVVGLSRARDNKTFQGLALNEEMAKRDGDERCAVMVIDLRTGDVVHWLNIEGVVKELYDVVVLPHCVRPMALGFQSDEIRRFLSLPPQA